MSIRAALCGVAVCCLAAVAQGQTTTAPPGNVSMADMKVAVGVLRPGLPCSVRALDAMSKYTPLKDCVPVGKDDSAEEDEEDEEGEDSSEEPARKKRSYYYYHCPYWWGLDHNSQRALCPRTNQTGVTQNLSSNATDYPLEQIATFMIVGRQAATTGIMTPFRALVATAVIPGQDPSIASDIGREVTPCPRERERLFSYTSSTFNTFCWVVQNLQPPVLVNLQCQQTCCSNCRATRGRTNLCYPQFQVFMVTAFCPSMQFLVSDTLLVPVDCTCRSVRCRRRGICRRRRWWGWSNASLNCARQQEKDPFWELGSFSSWFSPSSHTTTRHLNRCVTEFQRFSLWSFCPALPAGQRILRDRIIVPRACASFSVPFQVTRTSTW